MGGHDLHCRKNPDFSSSCGNNVRVNGHDLHCQKNPDFCSSCGQNVRVNGHDLHCRKNPDFCSSCGNNVRVNGHDLHCRKRNNTTCTSELVTARSYVMYHGTSHEAALSIERDGVVPSHDGMLGAGVYMSRDIRKARNYGSVVLKCQANVGRTKIINVQGHQLQKSWQDAGF